MKTTLKKTNELPAQGSIVYLTSLTTGLEKYGLTAQEMKFIKNKTDRKEELIAINRYSRWIYIQIINEKKSTTQTMESLRKSAFSLHSQILASGEKTVTIVSEAAPEYVCAFAEGLGLSNYRFTKYFSKEKKKQKEGYERINLISDKVTASQVDECQLILDSVYLTRDLVNEPSSALTAVRLSSEIQKIAREAGFHAETLNKKKIEALRMGGLLAVNKGSVDPPTFTILEWKPPKALNKKPYVLTGKGVVFDTGGLSLKPTKGSMDSMKSDMAGAAAVTGVFHAVAKARLPVHLIGLIPATDNRPGGNAYAPQDIITMHNGMTVEVLNTDAEGRMILADALSYAGRYKPEVIINIATLTGSASSAIGIYGMVGMGTAPEKLFRALQASGENVHERIVEFPFWDEYDELIKSDVADIKNIGGSEGGAITAGKFLARFTDFPFIHLDIAGPAFLEATDSYRGKGGSGVGVRLLFDFFKNIRSNK